MAVLKTGELSVDMVAIDLDGTLVDSVGDLHAALIEMQASLSLSQASETDVRHWVGNGIERLVHRALTGTMDDDAEPALFAPAFGAFLSSYQRVNGQSSVLYAGVAAGLDWLRSTGVPLVCVTNKAGRFSRPLLDRLGIADCFSHHIAGDDVAMKKPHPDALLEAARRCNAEPSRCALIGDSITDINAARAAGFHSVCVSYGYNHSQSVRDLSGASRPDAVVDSFSELPGVFARLARASDE